MCDIIYAPFLSYLKIAANAHERILHYIDEKHSTALYTDDFSQTADGQATIVIVYCSISLECYIYNYASRRLGETYCKKNIDRMSLYTKWLVVPKLVMGKAISCDHTGITLLQKLVKARNSIVHAKAINIKVEKWEQQKQNIIKADKEVLDAALNAFRCVGELGSALAKIDPNEPSANSLAEFLSTPKYQLKFS
jgi:hypothetical protein